MILSPLVCGYTNYWIGQICSALSACVFGCGGEGPTVVVSLQVLVGVGRLKWRLLCLGETIMP